jgi:hypothetical protein
MQPAAPCRGINPGNFGIAQHTLAQVPATSRLGVSLDSFADHGTKPESLCT